MASLNNVVYWSIVKMRLKSNKNMIFEQIHFHQTDVVDVETNILTPSLFFSASFVFEIFSERFKLLRCEALKMLSIIQ